MKCKISITAQNDIPAWVTKAKFEKYVNQDDLALRETQDILDFYHSTWFLNEENSDILFIPPAFEFRRGQLYGINSRYRAVLLFRHLSSIPMLLVNPGKWPKEKLNEIIERKITESEEIEIPNLPINYKLANTEKIKCEKKKENGTSLSDVHINIKIDF